MDQLKQIYSDRYNNYLGKISERLENYINEIICDYPRIDRVSSRAKSIESFLKKSEKKENGTLKYNDPLNQIQDQIGARVITYYLKDIEPVSKILKDYLSPIEETRISPDTDKEFGYEGKHYVFFIPEDLFSKNEEKENVNTFFELQIKTLYQHAWSEANHNLGYKTDRVLTQEEKRKIAFTAAQSWGADQIFNELFTNN